MPVSRACELLGVSRSGYHKWQTRPPSDRALSDAWLIEKITEIHTDNRGVYGAPRVHAELRLQYGIRVGRKRVERLMREAGRSGLVAQRYRGGQEDQLGALAFALIALVLWDAQYLDDAIAQLRATGREIADEDLRRLSPLQHEHIKVLGRFPFTLPQDLTGGARRQLRELGQAAWRTLLFHCYREARLHRSSDKPGGAA